MPARSPAALLALVAAVTAPARAQAPRAPEAGTFLVADDGLLDPNFRQTVVLILVHDGNGTFGLVVNRPSDTTLDAIVEDRELGKAAGAVVNVGGPVATGAMVALMRTERPPEDAVRVFGDVYLVTFDQAVARASDADSPARFYVGHAGWGAGQLQAEMDVGAWSVVPANDRHLFDMEASLVWLSLHGRATAGISLPGSTVAALSAPTGTPPRSAESSP